MRILKLVLLLLAAPLVAFCEDHTVDCNGVKIHYVVEGKGEPVVLIHGYLSSAFINWQLTGIFGALAKDYQVIAIDMPGHGLSDKPEKEDAYGTAMVEDVIKVMDQVDVKKAHIVGYSMGGIIAAKLVTKHADRVRSVALGGMGWLSDGGLLQKVYANAGKDKTALAICFRELSKLAITEAELKAIEPPVEMLVGDKDICKALYVDPAHKVRADWPVVEIKGADHLSCIIMPQYKEELKKWIDKQAKK
jgi:pimeloyl-ACP methyl ester carboxylesterase